MILSLSLSLSVWFSWFLFSRVEGNPSHVELLWHDLINPWHQVHKINDSNHSNPSEIKPNQVHHFAMIRRHVELPFPPSFSPAFAIESNRSVMDTLTANTEHQSISQRIVEEPAERFRSFRPGTFPANIWIY